MKFKQFSYFISEKSVQVDDNKYTCDNATKSQILILNRWLDERGIYYEYDKKSNKLKIIIDPKLDQEDLLILRQMMDNFKISKIWESEYATLGNTPGMGSVIPPSLTTFGSGDVIDNLFNDEEDEEDEEEIIISLISK